VAAPTNADLLVFLNTYLEQVDVYDASARTLTLTNIATIYATCLELLVNNVYIFHVGSHLYNYRLSILNPNLISNPVIFDSVSAGDLTFVGIAPPEGYVVVCNGEKLIEYLVVTNIGISDLLDGIFDRFENIPMPCAFQLYSGMGYKMNEFVIERWSEFELNSQSFRTNEVVFEAYTELPKNDAVNEFDTYLSSLSFSLNITPTPENTENYYSVIEVTNGFTKYSAVFKGNPSPTNTVVINHNPRNRDFLRYIYNKYRTYNGVTYLFDVGTILENITLYYI
jgi:hypothetical protein